MVFAMSASQTQNVFGKVPLWIAPEVGQRVRRAGLVGRLGETCSLAQTCSCTQILYVSQDVKLIFHAYQKRCDGARAANLSVLMTWPLYTSPRLQIIVGVVALTDEVRIWWWTLHCPIGLSLFLSAWAALLNTCDCETNRMELARCQN